MITAVGRGTYMAWPEAQNLQGLLMCKCGDWLGVDGGGEKLLTGAEHSRDTRGTWVPDPPNGQHPRPAAGASCVDLQSTAMLMLQAQRQPAMRMASPRRGFERLCLHLWVTCADGDAAL